MSLPLGVSGLLRRFSVELRSLFLRSHGHLNGFEVFPPGPRMSFPQAVQVNFLFSNDILNLLESFNGQYRLARSGRRKRVSSPRFPDLLLSAMFYRPPFFPLDDIFDALESFNNHIRLSPAVDAEQGFSCFCLHTRFLTAALAGHFPLLFFLMTYPPSESPRAPCSASAPQWSQAKLFFTFIAIVCLLSLTVYETIQLLKPDQEVFASGRQADAKKPAFA